MKLDLVLHYFLGHSETFGLREAEKELGGGVVHWMLVYLLWSGNYLRH